MYIVEIITIKKFLFWHILSKNTEYDNISGQLINFNKLEFSNLYSLNNPMINNVIVVLDVINILLLE